VLGARAAYIGGCAGTSNTLAGFRFGIPVMGTAAHSWVMSFCGELEAFRQLQRVLGEATVHVIDTYDTLEGARRAAQTGSPLWGVRLDSGDFLALSRQVRAILDEAGLHDAKIMASGDLDEHRIRNLVEAGAPIDAFGVGTQLATSADAPNLSAVYKLVELDIGGIHRFTAKLVEPLPALAQSRERAAECLAKLPPALRQLEAGEPWPVIYSRELRALTERTRRNLLG
jgi:nicotinate phosphoribosyltransferase